MAAIVTNRLFLGGLGLGATLGFGYAYQLRTDFYAKQEEFTNYHSKLERNKQNCKSFYSMMFNDMKPEEAIKEFTGDKYIQHNPEVEDGKNGFIKYFKKMHKEYPIKKVYFKKVFADGNYVILHCYQEWPSYGENYAGIDIFRLDDDGKVVEHWDVLQTIPDPKDAKNKNTMF